MNKILVLGTADWSQPIATNQHYMVRELAREFELIYVESIGLRRPEFHPRDLRRMGRRAFAAIRPTTTDATRRPVPTGVEVRTPLVIPVHTGLAARANRPRIRGLVADWMEQDTRVLWTYNPVTYGLANHATKVVYHCVDLLGEVDGIPAALIASAERELARCGPTALGSSDQVVAHLRDSGFANVLHWPNVADVAAVAAARPGEIARGDRVVFAGNLSEQKVDFGLLEGLLTAGVDLQLAGPVSEGGGAARASVERLIEQGATYHGLLSIDSLARLYWTCSVGLIPYNLNSYTLGVNPLKTFEYLAAGMSVVSTRVPAVEPRDGDVFVEDDRSAFIGAVCALRTPPTSEEIDRRQHVAEEHSWANRGANARALLRDEANAPDSGHSPR